MSLCLFMRREKRIGKERDKLQKRKRKDVSLKVFHPDVHFEDYQNFRIVLFTTRERSCEKVMFWQVCVCSRGDEYITLSFSNVCGL